MRDRDAFGTALQTLRQRLRDGVYRPGAPLVIIELAQELRISATPVREALARLGGEGLVEERRGWGYGVWRVDRDACEELYRLHLLHLELAQRRDRNGGPRLLEAIERAPPRVAGELRAATEAMFDAVVADGCEAYGLSAHRRLQDRLAPLRLAEARHFTDLISELRHVAAALERGTEQPATAELRAYHQRRIGAVNALVRLTSSEPSIDPNYSSNIA